MPNAPANQVLKLFPARNSTPGARDRILAIIDGEAQSIPAENVGSAGSGDVVGPASATDNAIARFDATTGKLLQNSGATLSDAGLLTASSIAAPGADTQVLFNDGGVLAGEAGLTFNKTTDKLTALGGHLVNPAVGETGIIYDGSVGLVMRSFGATPAVFQDTALRLASTSQIRWTDGGAVAGTADLVLSRDAAGALGLRVLTSPQSFRVYHTFTDLSNYERVALTFSGNRSILAAQSAGTGTPRALGFMTGGAVHWEIDTSGHHLAITDNLYNIGGIGTGRPKDLFLGGKLVGSVQSLSGPGAVNLTTFTTAFTSTGVGDALTLADGAVGQIKYIVHVVDGGSGVLTPSNLFNGSTITFTNLGESVILQFIGTEWHVIAINGAALA